MAIMITYGSYLPKHENLGKNTALICTMDTLVALIAGFIIAFIVSVISAVLLVTKLAFKHAAVIISRGLQYAVQHHARYKRAAAIAHIRHRYSCQRYQLYDPAYYYKRLHGDERACAERAKRNESVV